MPDPTPRDDLREKLKRLSVIKENKTYETFFMARYEDIEQLINAEVRSVLERLKEEKEQYLVQATFDNAIIDAVPVLSIKQELKRYE